MVEPARIVVEARRRAPFVKWVGQADRRVKRLAAWAHGVLLPRADVVERDTEPRRLVGRPQGFLGAEPHWEL